MAAAPCSSSLLLLQTTHLETPCCCHVTRGEGSGTETAILSLPGRWMVSGKQRKRKGGSQDNFAHVSACQRRPRGRQLFKPAAFGPEPGPAGRPAGQSPGILVDHQVLRRCLTCPQGCKTNPGVIVTPDSPCHPIPVFREWCGGPHVPTFA